MKKEHLILLISMVTIAISGAFIYMGQNSGPATSASHPGNSGMENTPTPSATPPGPDTTALRAQINILLGKLKADPNNFEILAGLGNNYYDIDEPTKAIEYYEKALKINPNEPAVIVDCGAMYRASGNADKAIEMFNRAIALDPRLPQAYFNLGMVLRMEKNQPGDAARAWKKYLELEPSSQARSFLEPEIEAALGNK